MALHQRTATPIYQPTCSPCFNTPHHTTLAIFAHLRHIILPYTHRGPPPNQISYAQPVVLLSRMVPIIPETLHFTFTAEADQPTEYK